MGNTKDCFTIDDLKKAIEIMGERPKHIALNPYVRIPADNDMTVAQQKEQGDLPDHVHLSKAVPLLTAYEFDASLLDFALPKPEPTKFNFVFATRYGYKL